MASAPAEEPVLCQSCGYTLEGLPVEGMCPECSRAIATSVPAHRTGADWQTRGWWAGLRAFIVEPLAQSRKLRHRTEDVKQQQINLWLAALLYAGALVSLEILQPAVWVINDRMALLVGHAANRSVVAGVLFVLLPALLWGALRTICTLESWGLRLIARKHRWRLSALGARLLVAHASYGWVLGGALVLPLCAWLRGNLAYAFLVGMLGRQQSAASYEFILALLLLGFFVILVGLIWFEAVVYFALRANRFANWGAPPRAAAPDATARSV